VLVGFPCLSFVTLITSAIRDTVSDANEIFDHRKTDSNMAPHSLKDFLQLRPAEIKTYHSETYDRISPTKSKFEAKGKTLFITAGGKSPTT
jgi:hypothetical protein